MNLEFTAHAIDQMQVRHISKGDIEAVLSNPIRSFENEDAVVYDGVVGGRIIRVVVSGGSNPPTNRDGVSEEALMEVRFDLEADALYVRLRGTAHARTEEIDSRRLIDYDDAGEVIGVEFLFVSKGISLEGVPEADRVAQALQAVPHPEAA